MMRLKINDGTPRQHLALLTTSDLPMTRVSARKTKKALGLFMRNGRERVL